MAHCKDRRKFAEQFALAAREYSEAVARLVLHEGPPAQAEYDALRCSVNETHDRCETAGLEFEQHVATHGCCVLTNKSHRQRGNLTAAESRPRTNTYAATEPPALPNAALPSAPNGSSRMDFTLDHTPSSPR